MNADRKTALIAFAASGTLRALARTWRMRAHNDEGFRAARERKQPVLFALWHGELLPLLWQHRKDDVYILISEHKDGEIVARIAHSLGYKTVRGSTSRGGSRALLGLSRMMAEGHNGAVTPDGPRGPAHVFAPGATVAAHRSGALIQPIRMQTDSAWRLNSWDKFTIPKPFATVNVYYGPPVAVLANSPRDAAEQAPAFEKLMDIVPA